MKVEFCKSIDIESEVNITVEDITEALRESLGEAKDSDREHLTLRFLSDTVSCLRAVDDRMIGRLTPKQCQLIANALREQVTRYCAEVNS